jgi:hypothetical protein
MPLEIDHILPEALGGSDDESNLWLACPRCNRFKGAAIDAVDPDSGELASLYNPRAWSWLAHFTWINNGAIIVGTSAIGRATVSALHMNNPFVVRARHVWVKWGWHPPQDVS